MKKKRGGGINPPPLWEEVIHALTQVRNGYMIVKILPSSLKMAIPQ